MSVLGRTSRRHRTAGILLVLPMVLVTACAGGRSTDPITVGPATSTAPTSTSTAPAGTPSTGTPPTGTPTGGASTASTSSTQPNRSGTGSAASESTLTTPTATPSAAQTVPSAENPIVGIIPPEFTGADRAAAEAAIKAYQGMWTVFGDASASPAAQDWEPELRRYAADPAALTLVRSIRHYADEGWRQVGPRWSTATVTGVRGLDVDLGICIDISHMQILNREGDVIFGDALPRQRWQVTVENFGAPGWLVFKLDIPKEARPC